MGLTKDQLIFKALVALDEVVAASKEGPVDPSASLRFVLAWLYAQSRDNDRTAYDAFWRIVQDDMLRCYSESEGNYIRTSTAMTELSGIARRAGFELTSQLQSQLYQARLTKVERDRFRSSSAFKWANGK